MKSRTRVSVVVVKDHQVLTFLAVDPHNQSQYHFLPGGGIEPEETAIDAAERETFEETGYRVHIDPFSATDREYTFSWNGETYDCLTIFYHATLIDQNLAPEPVHDADYNKKVVWVPVQKVDVFFSYSAEILDAVHELLR